jgi:hypothetical protein
LTSASGDISRTLPRLDHPHQLQAAYGVANRTAAYAEQLRQLALRRQLVAGTQFLENQRLDLLGDFFVHPALADGFEVGL